MIEYPDERGYPVLLGAERLLLGWIRRALPKPGTYHFLDGDYDGARHAHPTAWLTDAGELLTNNATITTVTGFRAVDHGQAPTA